MTLLSPLLLFNKTEYFKKDYYGLKNNTSYIASKGFIPFKDIKVYIYINIKYINIEKTKY